MNIDFIRKRISELRLKKGVSEYRMSTDIGRSKNYIQGISSGRSMPSMSEFIYMCGYLGISPRDFFDDGLENPALLQESINELKTFNDKDLTLILDIIRRFKEI